MDDRSSQSSLRALWSRNEKQGVATVYIVVDGSSVNSKPILLQLYNQDGLLREITLRPTEITGVLTISHPIGTSTYLYLKRGNEEIVIPEKKIPANSPLTVRGSNMRLRSLVDGLTDGYVSFSRSALEQIDAILSNL